MVASSGAFLALLVILAIYTFFAIIASGRIHSPFDFFHRSTEAENARTLFAADITLGTGVAYLLSAGLNCGFLWVLVPFAGYFGMRLLANFLHKAAKAGRLEGRNIIFRIDEQITSDTGIVSVFAKRITYAYLGVFILLLSFELFASSQIISVVLFNEPTVVHQFIVALIIASFVLLYTTWGGIREVDPGNWTEGNSNFAVI